MTDEDRDMANAALLLDAKIRERLRKELSEIVHGGDSFSPPELFPSSLLRSDVAQMPEIRSMMFKVAYEVCATMLMDMKLQMQDRMGISTSPSYIQTSGQYQQFTMPYGSYQSVLSVAQLPRLVF